MIHGRGFGFARVVSLKRWQVMLVVGLLALTIRTVCTFVIVPQWQDLTNTGSCPDLYPLLARSILEGGPFGYAPAGASPTTVRGPGYALWLAVGMLLSDGVPFLGFWSALPGVLGAMLVAAIGWRRFGAMGAVLGGGIAGCHPLPVFVSTRVMGDEFSAVAGFGAAFFLCSGLSQTERNWWRIGAGIFLLSWALLTRTTVLFLLIVLATLILSRTWIAGRRSRATLVMTVARLLTVVLVLAVSLVPFGLWSLRSSRLEGRPVLLHSLASYNWWIGEAHHRLGIGESWVETRAGENWMLEEVVAGTPEAAIVGRWYGELRPLEVHQLERRLFAAALEEIRNSPEDYLRRVFCGIGRFWTGGTSQRRSRHYMLANLPVVFLALAGTYRLIRRRRDDRGQTAGWCVEPLEWVLIMWILLLNVAYALTLPVARMSVQIYPALAYLAAAVATGTGTAENHLAEMKGPSG